MITLLIGPRYNKRDKNKVGGIVVLFENLIEYFNEKGLQYKIIDTNKSNYYLPLIAYISIIFQLFSKFRGCNVVMLNGTFNDYRFIGPIVQFLCRLTRRPYVLRKFAGNFHTLYLALGNCSRKLIQSLLNNAAICYWETKELVEWGTKFNHNSFWFPNVRKCPCVEFVNPEQRKPSLMFMSHVRKEKGVGEILEAYKLIGNEYDLEIYGTLMDYSKEQLCGKYRGVISPKDVAKTLSTALLLLLPSWGEGYPGIVIEAFSVGLPVLASKVGGIPEMITDGYNGVLVEPNDYQSIIKGIQRFKELDYDALCHNALASFDAYDADLVNHKVVEDIRHVAI